jgi:hypothetical protein
MSRIGHHRRQLKGPGRQSLAAAGARTLLLLAATARAVVQGLLMQQGMGMRRAVLAGMSVGIRRRSSQIQVLLVPPLLLLLLLTVVVVVVALLPRPLQQMIQQQQQQQQQVGTSMRTCR